MVLSIFGVLLRSIEEYAGSFSLILDGTLPIPSKVSKFAWEKRECVFPRSRDSDNNSYSCILDLIVF